MAKRVVFSSVGAVGPGASNLVGSAPSHATLGIWKHNRMHFLSKRSVLLDTTQQQDHSVLLYSYDTVLDKSGKKLQL